MIWVSGSNLGILTDARFEAWGQYLCIEIKRLLSTTGDCVSPLQICSFDVIVENCADRP